MRDRKIKVETNIQFTFFGVESTQVRQPSLVDDFFYRSSVCPDTGKPMVRVNNPLYMLFNQERLDRLGDAAVQMWLRSLESSGNDATQQILKKVSDDDLLKMIKSRHIQHPCEMERYLHALNERAEYFNSEVARVLAEEKAAADKKQSEIVKDLEVKE